jgi:hypothetical protein
MLWECELCSNKGGTYHLTNVPNKLVHSLCSLWLLESEEVTINGQQFINIDNIKPMQLLFQSFHKFPTT